MSHFIYDYQCNMEPRVLPNQLVGEMSKEHKSTQGIFCREDSN